MLSIKASCSCTTVSRGRVSSSPGAQRSVGPVATGRASPPRSNKSRKLLSRSGRMTAFSSIPLDLKKT
eukprot:10043493-Prorocentrum_lima.AAC.1